MDTDRDTNINFTMEAVATRIRASATQGGNHLKITPQRRLIIQTLVGNTTHPSAEDVFNQVKGLMPEISLSTVYKTLNELVKLGVLGELKYDGEQSRFDPRTDQHSHLICIKKWPDQEGRQTICGRLEDISVSFPTLNVPTQEQHGFLITGNEVIFHGYCPTCRARLGL